MKKIAQSLRHNLPILKVYREHLEKVFGILSMDGRRDVNIRHLDCEYDSVDDLCENVNGVIQQLTFRISDPYVSVDFSPMEAHIWANEDDIISHGITSEIQCALKPCYRKIVHSIFSIRVLWALIIASSIIPWFISDLKTSKYVFVFLILLMLLWLTPVYFYRVKSYCTIVLSKSHETPSFWRRNRDQLIVKLIFLIVGVLLGLLVKDPPW